MLIEKRYGSLAATGKHSFHLPDYNIFINLFACLGKGYDFPFIVMTIIPDYTRKSHHTPQAILLGLEGSDPETIDTGTIPSRYDSILSTKSLLLGGKQRIVYDMDRDMLWRWDQVLKTHPNGMRFACFGEEGDLLAVNEYYRYVGLGKVGVIVLMGL